MQTGEIVIYQTKDGESSIEVKLQGETLWLTQEQMAHLFQKDRSVITKHINNIFKEGELDQESNVQNLHIAHSDKPVKHLAIEGTNLQFIPVRDDHLRSAVGFCP